ncbi:Uncharacterized conserved protein, DUF305 family [Saccharopolyspora antimicrobica]|uniref:Uncharacterized conserved protein, DUF305 family n=1 Tax=Saccharopolyspora antimicrobica TaxID=455193 RepID=A0A1I5GL67_9PSEU|nr:DUF305 domain-containing protein [Saccharopolyspora antimicrobica]RKT87485.1 uncharacterized protein (DUF305 family) [Saccharopolyspora antimicrobica]SFO36693.1 Uncharacterized conserved protein, DUF305 family [Saccharopolyspora antimicrobica]
MKRTRAFAAAITAVAAIALAGCGNGGTPPPEAPASQEQAASNAADVTFAQGMIPHHEQAIEMSRLAPERAESQQVKDLAKQIEAAQGPEIATLNGWLGEWGAGPGSSTDHSAMGHGDMGGMMTGDEMKQLEQSKGAEFDRMFLELMIKHHEGAVTMARTELSDGQFPAAKQMAQQIIDTQQAEIDTMRALLSQS